MKKQPEKANKRNDLEKQKDRELIKELRLRRCTMMQISKHPDLRYELTNGRVLCVDCHKKTSNYGMRNKKRLKVNMEAKSKHGS